jgi:hypothetical protein
MEACNLILRGPEADAFADSFLETKATEAKRSLNKRGVRNVHRYKSDGFAQITYEQGSASDDSWPMVSLLVETVDDRTRTVVFVGGEEAFKLEEIPSGGYERVRSRSDRRAGSRPYSGISNGCVWS